MQAPSQCGTGGGGIQQSGGVSGDGAVGAAAEGFSCVNTHPSRVALDLAARNLGVLEVVKDPPSGGCS